MTKNLSVQVKRAISSHLSSPAGVFKCPITEARNKEAARKQLFAIQLFLSKQIK